MSFSHSKTRKNTHIFFSSEVKKFFQIYTKTITIQMDYNYMLEIDPHYFIAYAHSNTRRFWLTLVIEVKSDEPSNGRDQWIPQKLSELCSDDLVVKPLNILYTNTINWTEVVTYAEFISLLLSKVSHFKLSTLINFVLCFQLNNEGMIRFR